MDRQQSGQISRSTIIKPQQRYDEIMKIARKNQFDRDRYLKELNIRVHDKDMLQVEGNLLFFLFSTTVSIYI